MSSLRLQGEVKLNASEQVNGAPLWLSYPDLTHVIVLVLSKSEEGFFLLQNKKVKNCNKAKSPSLGLKDQENRNLCCM